MSKRNEWKFPYPAGRVAEAADRRALHHRGRETYWQEQFDAAREAFRTSVEVRETPDVRGLTAAYDVTSNRMREMDVVADPQKRQHMENCRTKVRQHRERAVTMEGFAAVLSANPELTVNLHVDDVLFFGLAGTPEPESGEGE